MKCVNAAKNNSEQETLSQVLAETTEPVPHSSSLAGS